MNGRTTLALLMSFALQSAAAALPGFTSELASGSAVTVFVDSSKLPASAIDVAGGQVYVALRAAGHAFGADVSYNAKKKRVTVTTLLRQSVFIVGAPNGAKMFQGQVMVPLRLLAGALGVRVAYDNQQHVVHLNTAGLLNPPSGAPTVPPTAKASTLQGSVLRVSAQAQPAVVEIQADQATYTIAIPPGTPVQFRDTRGEIAASGGVQQIKPGDVLIATVDATGHLLAVADIFAGRNGTISAISGPSMVLTDGNIVTADATATTVVLDGSAASLSDLKAGDRISVRANPRTGRIREIVALSPAGAAQASPQGGASPGAAMGTVSVASVTDDAPGPLHAGQTLHVSATGTAGASATFDLSDVLLDLRMRETASGRYEGAYTVAMGTNLVDAPLLVHLRKGADTSVAAASEPLTIITEPPQVKDIAPSAGARINTLRPSIYATFATLGGKGMDTGSLRVFVNGKDVSDQATRTAGFASYYPAADLPPGRISVEIKGSDVAGNPLDYRWSFTVIGE